MSGSSRKLSFVRTLYFRVLVGVVAGVLIGVFWPGVGESLRPFGDGFIKLVRMIVAPIIFLSVVVGIAGVGDLRRLGRIGLKSLLYFEVVSTIALLLGMTVAAIVQPGRSMNVDAHSLDTKVVAKYAEVRRQLRQTSC